jgi:CBS domain-containing protein
MSAMTSKLDKVAKALKENRSVEPVTVREFLGWFGAQRRGIHVVREIRHELERVGVETHPDFEPEWTETPISFRLTHATCGGSVEAAIPSDEIEQPIRSEHLAPGDGQSMPWVSRDPSYRISKLEAANAGVIRVSPDNPISTAVTQMMIHDYSQLPVMTSDREVKGIISWRSIGTNLSLGKNLSLVREAMEQSYEEVRADASIFEVINLIVQHGYVLIRSHNQTITGIVTASDLSLQFRLLTEPFLILSEIENLVRNLIGSRFNANELREACDADMGNRKVDNVSDLNFGEYVRLLEQPERWERLKLTINRTLFCSLLDQVRTIRNDVMHFDPDGISKEDLLKLRNFAQFLNKLDKIGIALI